MVIKGNVLGRYVRKQGTYDASNSWQRKWTYKVGWEGSGDVIRLMAMTDGMLTRTFSKGSFSRWMHENGMVFMTTDEVLQFIQD